MLTSIPKDLIAQYDTLVAQNEGEWEARVDALGPSALLEKRVIHLLQSDL